MSDLPSSRDELTWRHAVAHHTLLPAIGVAAGVVVGGPVAWGLGYVSFGSAMAIPWAALAGISLYIVLFGEYVMPGETYRKIKRGEWGETDE